MFMDAQGASPTLLFGGAILSPKRDLKKRHMNARMVWTPNDRMFSVPQISRFIQAVMR